jgi:hypothetical protein
LAHFTTSWQGESRSSPLQKGRFPLICALSADWHEPCLNEGITAGMAREPKQGDGKMLSYDHLARTALAAVGALVLSTLSVAAAVGPAQAGTPAGGWIGAAQFKAPANA